MFLCGWVFILCEILACLGFEIKLWAAAGFTIRHLRLCTAAWASLGLTAQPQVRLPVLPQGGLGALVGKLHRTSSVWLTLSLFLSLPFGKTTEIQWFAGGPRGQPLHTWSPRLSSSLRLGFRAKPSESAPSWGSVISLTPLSGLRWSGQMPAVKILSIGNGADGCELWR